MKKVFVYSILCLIPMVSSVSFAVAAIPGFSPSERPVSQPWFRPSPVPKTDLNDVLLAVFDNRILLAVYTILGSLAVLLLILAGIQYITAAGNAEKIKKARQSILQIILGIVVLASSYAIIALILGLANFLARQSPP